MTTLDIHQILKLLPHRYPFLLVDRVLEMEKGKRIMALKNVTMNEPFFNGHFPHRPVMPGVLMLEAMAQAAALLSFHSLDIVPDDNTVYFTSNRDGNFDLFSVSIKGTAARQLTKTSAPAARNSSTSDSRFSSSLATTRSGRNARIWSSFGYLEPPTRDKSSPQMCVQ